VEFRTEPLPKTPIGKVLRRYCATRSWRGGGGRGLMPPEPERPCAPTVWRGSCGPSSTGCALRETRSALDAANALLPALRRWQALRLARTYADLSASERHGPATAFFLSDLYGDRDFTERDRSLERAYPLLVKVLPDAALLPVARAIGCTRSPPS
jgi:hypothetical protein